MVNETSKKSGNTETILEARRKSVKKILGAGGLIAGGHLAGSEWVRPTVESVILPAHAQTSPGEIDSLDDPCILSVTCTNDGIGTVMVNGSVEPPTANVNVDIVFTALEEVSSSEFEIASPSTATNGSGEYEFTVTGVDLSNTNQVSAVEVEVTLPDFPEAGTAECRVDVDDSGPHEYDSSTYFCDGVEE